MHQYQWKQFWLLVSVRSYVSNEEAGVARVHDEFVEQLSARNTRNFSSNNGLLYMNARTLYAAST